jgi:hypothetical protein
VRTPTAGAPYTAGSAGACGSTPTLTVDHPGSRDDCTRYGKRRVPLTGADISRRCNRKHFLALAFHLGTTAWEIGNHIDARILGREHGIWVTLPGG